MWIHKYLLQPRDSLNSRSNTEPRLGFFVKNSDSPKKLPESASPEDLIKYFQNYSEFIHWPELGDPSLSELKHLLIKTTEKDFQFPFSFTEKNLVTVKSNALISRYDRLLGEEMEIFQDEKFEVLKFKMGRNFKDEYTALMKLNLKSYLVRIDLNNSLNFKEAKEALAMLKKIPNLEYAEDPTEYGDYQWSELEKIAPVALDHFAPIKSYTKTVPKHFQYRILKPLRGISLPEITQWTIEKKKIVVTNMMDNIVGTWKAYFYFCELKKHFPYHTVTPGFHTHTLFSNYEHLSLLGFRGSEWTFDKLKLQKLLGSLDRFNWSPISPLDNKNLDEIIKESEARL